MVPALLRAALALGAAAVADAACGIRGCEVAPNASQPVCSEKASCEECLAEDGGCHGWLGDMCCSELECQSAVETDRWVYKSCSEWRQDLELQRRCSNILEEDVCDCIAAGCVAQELPDGGNLCMAHEQPAAGRRIQPSECREPFGFASPGQGEGGGAAAAAEAQFCEGSPPQHCRMMCRPVLCSPGQCAMRRGNCCDIACQGAGR